jgi:hypothetical protein
MSVIEDAVREHEERCNENIEKRLVSWKWLITVIAGFLVTLLTTAWTLASSTTESRVKINEHEKRITQVEDIYKGMREDIKFIRKQVE